MKLAQRIAISYYVNKIRAIEFVSPVSAAKAAFNIFCTPYSGKRKLKQPPIFIDAERLSFNFLHYTVRGFRWMPPQNIKAKTVLICHGFDSYSYKFESYIQPLIDAGFCVLAFDAPAHGISSGKTINANQYKQMILDINKLYGPVDGILAHSFGGLAVALAIEQLEAQDKMRLVLVAPATETTRAIEGFFKIIPVSGEVRTEFEKLLEKMGGNPANWFSVSRVLQKIKTPTLWVHDEDDNITPFADVKPMTEKNLPHIVFEITTGLGHSNIYKDKTIRNKIVEFLTSGYTPIQPEQK